MHVNKETYRKLMDKIQFSDDLTQNVMEKIDSLQDQRISLSSLQKRITALTAVLGIAAAAAFGIYNFSGNILNRRIRISKSGWNRKRYIHRAAGNHGFRLR